ncbi:hypothetical protein AAIH70_29990 [Neorhizobium sp. BT27B]|uniref:hypothetical protein n=1 Tax=Neorhizobium sp. BT27B TaxID=3142625 RepID=UPI003D2DEC72
MFVKTECWRRELRIFLGFDQCESVSDWRGEARRAIADLKIDSFNRAALYKYEA